MKRPADYSELDLSPEEDAGVQKYRALVQRRKEEGRRRRFLAEVKDQYPGLDPETYHELADAAYRKYMSDSVHERLRLATTE